MWPVKAYMSAPEAPTSTGTLPIDWAPSTRVRAPRSRARAQISRRGNTSPLVQSTCERATRRVLGVMAASTLLGGHGRRYRLHLHAGAPRQVVEGDEASGVFGGGRDRLVALSPVDGGDAKVHAVGGVLREGYVSGRRPDEAGCGLAGALPQLALAREEAGAFEVGRARAQVVCRAHRLDRRVRRRPAGAGVQVDVVVVGEGREHLARVVGLRGDASLLPGDREPFCIISASCRTVTCAG